MSVASIQVRHRRPILQLVDTVNAVTVERNGNDRGMPIRRGLVIVATRWCVTVILVRSVETAVVQKHFARDRTPSSFTLVFDFVLAFCSCGARGAARDTGYGARFGCVPSQLAAAHSSVG